MWILRSLTESFVKTYGTFSPVIYVIILFWYGTFSLNGDSIFYKFDIYELQFCKFNLFTATFLRSQFLFSCSASYRQLFRSETNLGWFIMIVTLPFSRCMQVQLCTTFHRIFAWLDLPATNINWHCVPLTTKAFFPVE